MPGEFGPGPETDVSSSHHIDTPESAGDAVRVVGGIPEQGQPSQEIMTQASEARLGALTDMAAKDAAQFAQTEIGSFGPADMAKIVEARHAVSKPETSLPQTGESRVTFTPADMAKIAERKQAAAADQKQRADQARTKIKGQTSDRAAQSTDRHPADSRGAKIRAAATEVGKKTADRVRTGVQRRRPVSDAPKPDVATAAEIEIAHAEANAMKDRYEQSRELSKKVASSREAGDNRAAANQDRAAHHHAAVAGEQAAAAREAEFTAQVRAMTDTNPDTSPAPLVPDASAEAPRHFSGQAETDPSVLRSVEEANRVRSTQEAQAMATEMSKPLDVGRAQQRVAEALAGRGMDIRSYNPDQVKAAAEQAAAAASEAYRQQLALHVSAVIDQDTPGERVRLDGEHLAYLEDLRHALGADIEPFKVETRGKADIMFFRSVNDPSAVIVERVDRGSGRKLGAGVIKAPVPIEIKHRYYSRAEREDARRAGSKVRNSPVAWLRHRLGLGENVMEPSSDVRNFFEKSKLSDQYVPSRRERKENRRSTGYEGGDPVIWSMSNRGASSGQVEQFKQRRRQRRFSFLNMFRARD